MVINMDTILNRADRKMKVAFFPYKAAMWDSLESVYLAAKADKDCEVLVAAVPYYEYDAKSDEWVIHYDGDRFSPEIEVTDYRSLALADAHIDLAFIHYPYDRGNRVTRLFDGYNSDELKRFVKKLVYIPYYVTGGFVSEGHTRFPVYYHADLIIAQSEIFKSGFKGLPYYDKVRVLGSPKIDAVIRRQKQCTPETKKRVFLNTSLQTFLGQGRAYLDKLKSVFELFLQQSSLELVWRPHPLFEATVKSMRPELKDYYSELLTYFSEKEIGTFDTSDDFDRVVAECDAYIGEESTSVVNLFAALQKPVFILDTFVTGRKSDSYIGINSLRECESGLEIVTSTGIALWCNGLSDIGCSGHAHEGMTRIQGSLELEDMLWTCSIEDNLLRLWDKAEDEHYTIPVGPEGLGYCAITFDGEYFYLAESHSGNVLRWDMENGITAVYELSGSLSDIGNGVSLQPPYLELINAGGYIYAIPYLSGTFAAIEKATGNVRYLQLSFVYEAIENLSDQLEYVISGEKLPVPVFSFAGMAEGRLVLQRAMDKAVMCYEICDSGELKETSDKYIYPKADMSGFDGFVKNPYSMLFARREDEYFTLSEFLEDLKEERLTDIKERQRLAIQDMAVNLNGDAGDNIYRAAKGLLD